MTDRPAEPTRAEIQAQRGALTAATSRSGRTRHANVWLAGVTIMLVLVTAGLSAAAALAWNNARDMRHTDAPLEARASKLRNERRASNTAIDDLSALFIAIKAHNDATTAAVDATNQAAAQYNRAEAPISTALGAEATTAVAALTQATTVVQTAAKQARIAIAAVDSSGSST